jgi:hypothetical protein
MMATVARKQVLVQLDTAQVARLDALDAGEGRSELIRRAIDLYLGAVDERVEDVRYAEAYERLPEDPAELGAFRTLADRAWPLGD